MIDFANAVSSHKPDPLTALLHSVEACKAMFAQQKKHDLSRAEMDIRERIGLIEMWAASHEALTAPGCAPEDKRNDEELKENLRIHLPLLVHELCKVYPESGLHAVDVWEGKKQPKALRHYHLFDAAFSAMQQANPYFPEEARPLVEVVGHMIAYCQSVEKGQGVSF